MVCSPTFAEQWCCRTCYRTAAAEIAALPTTVVDRVRLPHSFVYWCMVAVTSPAFLWFVAVVDVPVSLSPDRDTRDAGWCITGTTVTKTYIPRSVCDVVCAHSYRTFGRFVADVWFTFHAFTVAGYTCLVACLGSLTAFALTLHARRLWAALRFWRTVQR